MEEMRQQLRVDSRPNSVLEHVEKSVLHLGMIKSQSEVISIRNMTVMNNFFGRNKKTVMLLQ